MVHGVGDLGLATAAFATAEIVTGADCSPDPDGTVRYHSDGRRDGAEHLVRGRSVLVERHWRAILVSSNWLRH